MKNSDSNNWLVPLLAAFAIYVPLSSTSSPDQKSSALSQSPSLIQMVPLATPTPAPTPESGRVPGEAAKLLCDFFGAKPDLDQDAQGRNSDQKRIRPIGPQDFAPKNLRGDYCRIKSVRDLNKVEYLIATVPDPKDSRLDYMFDRYMDVIQVAIGDAGYTFDSYWLPWDRSGSAAPVSSPADPKTPQMSMATRYLYDPGVILFRNDKGLLLLFVVGETPTGGIHKVAFQNALWQIEELAGWRDPKTKEATEKELRILSPSFSGSAESLATLLKPWIHEYEYLTPPKVRIVSGSATSIDKTKLLEKIAGKGVEFQTTVIHVQEANDKFFNYLGGLDPQSKLNDDPKIALLSEASTSHGQTVREELKGPISPILSLTFPLHISQLRVEAARQSPSRDEMARALAARSPGLALPMREAGSPVSKDILPLFSPAETVTMELALGEALSAIHRERIRYVGVMSTDVQDRIFLVREIRKHCPNAMIFIQTDDLLYLHSESNLDFQGALVISSYPLFGLNQLWTYPFAGGRNRLQFSTYTSGDGKDVAPQLGLSRNFWSPTGIGILLLVGGACLFLPLVFLTQSVLFWGRSKVDKAHPDQWREGRSKLGRAVIERILELEREIQEGNVRTWLRPFAWVRRGWMGQVFGDEQFYCYRMDRRINLMSCCVSLVAITLFISSVAMLPAWISWKMTAGKPFLSRWDQDLTRTRNCNLL